MKNQSFLWLMELVGTQKKRVITSMCLAVVYSLFAIVPYLIIYHMVDGFVQGTITDSNEVWLWVLAAGGSLIAKQAFQLASGLLSHKAAFQLLFEVRQTVVERVGHLTLGESNKKASASMKKIISDDIEKMENFIAHHLPDMAAAIVTPLMATCVLIYIDWRLAFWVLLPLPIAIFLQMQMFKDFNHRVESYYRVVNNLHISIVDYVKSISVVKTFNMKVDSHKKYRNSVDEHHQLITDWLWDSKTAASLFKLSLELGFVFLLPVSVWLYSTGDLALPTLFVFMLLGVGLMDPLNNLLQFGGMFSEMLKGVESIKQFCTHPPQNEGSKEQSISSTDIVFDKVDFRHYQAAQNTLTDVSFVAEQGQVTAIVGPSGAGKTTIAQLIPRYFDHQSGTISIGGVAIETMPIDQLMSLISFVFQDVFIFEQTIADNIRMGNEALTEEDIENAAKAACAHEFIQELPHGYQTKVKQGSLSGGQAQRIAIARAIAKDSPILILDEATAYADARNEVRIQQAISRLMKGKTVLVIAHRLNTLTQVDKIVVMKDGCKVSEGTHLQLLTGCELYRSMWEAHQRSKSWHLGGQQPELEETVATREGEQTC